MDDKQYENQAQREAAEQARILKRGIDALNQKAAAASRNQPNPPAFDELCEQYAQRDTWTISEAALLLHSCHPTRPVPLPGSNGTLDEQIKATQSFLTSCVGVSLPPVGRMPALRKLQTRIKVRDLVRLAEEKAVAIPDSLATALGVDAGDEPEHGNKLRNQAIRDAACKAADDLVTRKPRAFLKSDGEPNLSRLAKYLESHPAEWAPDGMAPSDGGSLRTARTLRELLGIHFN
ncbi:MAG: hypothetical protein PF501_18385 [Salinisphaera sp.]|jgi:hypothetical protein|nr:hypothetical protein [Salinisphaera sp.]